MFDLDEIEIVFNPNSCRFDGSKASNSSILSVANTLKCPISVILQITRECNFSCVFCSEPEQIPDTTLDELELVKQNLKGVKRIFLSGGEPLTRTDLPKIIDIFHGYFIIGLPTNALASSNLIQTIKEKINFVNIGLDGPRNITTQVRGNYDLIMKGLMEFRKHDIPLSITCVVLRSTSDTLLYTCQIADVVGAKKVKFITPIPRGNAINLPVEEYLPREECEELFKQVMTEKNRCGWTPEITFTTWSQYTEGYSILMYPNGQTYAWPVFDETEKVLFLGNLFNETIEKIWERYPYKVNHLRKYLSKSIFVC